MKNIPNIITCLNLFSGCLACVMAMQGSYVGAFIFVCLAAVFDFLDGFAARLLKAYSNIGKELDSLADVISFGLAPGLLVFSFLELMISHLPLGSSLPFMAFLLPIFSAVRLAKFNIDTRQTTSFLGLPVPANGLFWSALIPAISPYLSSAEGNDTATLLVTGVIFLFIIVFGLLMVSELPMFSLKFKNYGWKGNELRYILIICAVVAVALFKLFGMSITICIYILMSALNNQKTESN